MNWLDLLQKEFGDDVIEAKETYMDSMLILDITVKYTDLVNINTISTKINNWFDSQNIDRFDSISIHSPGVNLNYNIDELQNHINEDLLIKLHKNENQTDHYKAQLLEVESDSILVKWNQKGNIRKIKINKNNILSVEKYIKF